MIDMLIIEIHSGRRNTYRYRKELFRSGLQFEKRAYGRSHFVKQIEDSNLSYWKKFCKRRGLKLISCDTRYERSADYRRKFLAAINSDKVFCAYCGRRVPISKATVDHIVPVQKAKQSRFARFLLRIRGIHDVNDSRNLVCACASCNSKKRTKMGLWIPAGIIGKLQWLWPIRWGFRIVIVIGMIVAVLFVLAKK